MATVTRENIGLLNDKLTFTINYTELDSAANEALKEYAKKTVVPGFRKGVAPLGLVKKKYGSKVYTEAILKKAERAIIDYIAHESIAILFHPMPFYSLEDIANEDFTQKRDYSLSYEIGLMPEIDIQTENIPVTKYQVIVGDDTIENDIESIQLQYGVYIETDKISHNEEMLNIILNELDEQSNEKDDINGIESSVYVSDFSDEFIPQTLGLSKGATLNVTFQSFKEQSLKYIFDENGIDSKSEEFKLKSYTMLITNVKKIEKAELNEELFKKVFPNKPEITTLEAFKQEFRQNIENYYKEAAERQVEDQIYHHLVDQSNFELPKNFILRVLEIIDEKKRTPEEALAYYPDYSKSFVWSLVTAKLKKEYDIKVFSNEIKELAYQEAYRKLGPYLQYLKDANPSMLEEYAEKMSKDKTFKENAIQTITVGKILLQLASKQTPKEETISIEDFKSKMHHHHY